MMKLVLKSQKSSVCKLHGECVRLFESVTIRFHGLSICFWTPNLLKSVKIAQSVCKIVQNMLWHAKECFDVSPLNF